MPWVSNLTSSDITVTITTTSGGNGSIYSLVRGDVENSGKNWWGRGGKETAKVTLGNGKTGSVTISPNQHLYVYDNALEVADSTWTWM